MPAGTDPQVSSIARLTTMARLHRENRYERATGDLERLTGRPGQTFEQHVRAQRGLFDATK